MNTYPAIQKFRFHGEKNRYMNILLPTAGFGREMVGRISSEARAVIEEPAEANGKNEVTKNGVVDAGKK